MVPPNIIVDSIITRTIEESAELIHVLSKVQRFGWYNYHPRDTKKVPNWKKALAEINDVMEQLAQLKLHMQPIIPTTPQIEFTDEVEEFVYTTLTDSFGATLSKIRPTSDFNNDLGFDSLDSIEFVMALEHRFGIKIPDELAMELKTVQQLIDYVRAHK